MEDDKKIFQYQKPWDGYFEVPVSWLYFSEIEEFEKQIEFYISAEDQEYELVELQKIKPPKRNEGVKSLHKCRTVSILCGIKNEWPIPPIKIIGQNNEYAVVAGFHRYHCSIIAGFTQIPAIIIKE